MSFSDDIIINNDQGANHITSSASDLISTRNLLTGTSDAGILDGNGNLIGNNAQYLGTSGYQQVAAPISAPTITSPGIAVGKSGTVFSYQVVATKTPSSFSATGLPAGLSIDSSTGLISGTPVNRGAVNVSLSATNSSGTATATIYLMITGD